MQQETIDLCYNPDCGDRCQKTVNTLMKQIEALTSERDTTVAGIFELGDDRTELVNDFRRDATRMQARIGQLEQQAETNRTRLQQASALVATCLRSLADLIASR